MHRNRGQGETAVMQQPVDQAAAGRDDIAMVHPA